MSPSSRRLDSCLPKLSCSSESKSDPRQSGCLLRPPLLLCHQRDHSGLERSTSSTSSGGDRRTKDGDVVNALVGETFRALYPNKLLPWTKRFSGPSASKTPRVELSKSFHITPKGLCLWEVGNKEIFVLGGAYSGSLKRGRKKKFLKISR